MKRRSLTLAGLSIALLGFFLTRFTVTFGASQTRLQFFFGGLVPMILGLSLSAGGVMLTVSKHDKEYVRTVAIWSLLGTLTMLVLILLTVLGTDPELSGNPQALHEHILLANYLIGGAVGGALTGVYAAQSKQQQVVLEQRTNRLVFLNRLLRDKVINSGMVIKGHIGVIEDNNNPNSVETIERQTEHIVETVKDVKHLVRTSDDDSSIGDIDLKELTDSAATTIKSEYPEKDFEINTPHIHTTVKANKTLKEALYHLISNSIKHNDAETPVVNVSHTQNVDNTIVHIEDNGPGIPENQQKLLETGKIAKYDDPSTGFGLNIVRLLVERFNGQINTQVSEKGTTVSLILPSEKKVQTDGGAKSIPVHGNVFSKYSILSGLVAAAVMSVAITIFDGNINIMYATGGLYGIQDHIVGGITHVFHSVVFALGYAGLISTISIKYSATLQRQVTVSIIYALILWTIAAGFIMPLWLILVGFGELATIPNLTITALAGHIIWGVTVAVSYQYSINRWASLF